MLRATMLMQVHRPLHTLPICRKSGPAACTIAMVVEGTSRLDAARQTGMDRQTLRDWVHRYNQAGFDGLASRKPPGASPKLSEAQIGNSMVS